MGIRRKWNSYCGEATGFRQWPLHNQRKPLHENYRVVWREVTLSKRKSASNRCSITCWFFKWSRLGFKPKTFRTGICHSISLSIPLFMGIFGIPQKRICADFAPIRLVNALLSVAKVRESEQKAKIIMDFFVWGASNEHKFGRLYRQFGKFSIKSSLF